MRTGPAAFVVLLTLGGCVTFEKDTESGGPGGPQTTGDGTTSGASGEETTPTTGDSVAGVCDVWEQDCGADAKCAPYDSKATGVVDTTRCVPLAQPAKQAGDACQAEGGIVGQDDCDLGLLCWQLDLDGDGVCVPLCTGSPLDPSCGEGLVCDVASGGILPLCLTTCDPLAPACSMGQLCIPSFGGLFVCDADGGGDGGAYGDACAYVNVCDLGLLCVSGEAVPGCQTDGCCTEYCDINLPADGQCSGAPQQECLSVYPDEEPPPGNEDVGYCGIPQ